MSRLIGRYGGRPLLYRVSCWARIRGHFLLPPSKVREGERFFQGHGIWVILIARSRADEEPMCLEEREKRGRRAA